MDKNSQPDRQTAKLDQYFYWMVNTTNLIKPTALQIKCLILYLSHNLQKVPIFNFYFLTMTFSAHE